MLSYPCYSDFDPTLLVRECGKMEVLDRLLVKLHATGHRVLLFSTMTKARRQSAVSHSVQEFSLSWSAVF